MWKTVYGTITNIQWRCQQRREVLLISVVLKKRHPSEGRPTLWSCTLVLGNSPTGVVGQIQRKYRRKQLEHLPLSTTARHILTLLSSIAVKHLYLRNLRFPSRTLSLCRTNAQTGCQPFQRHENYIIALASLYMLNAGNKFENYI